MRKVSSYDVSRSRERPMSKIQDDRSIPLHRERASDEAMR